MSKICIIGHGPAGISAAIYLKRSGLDPIVIGKDYGTYTEDEILIENYYGFSKPISGKSLILEGINQAKRLGIEIKTDAVLDLFDQGDSFKIVTLTQTLYADAILLATGKRRESLKIPGAKKYIGKGISFCATCDGFFYRRKKLAIIGNGPYMKQELEHLSRLSDDITVFTNQMPMHLDVNYPVITDKIIRFNGDTKITSIQTNNETYDVDGIFVAIGTPSSIDFAKKLGVILNKNDLMVNEKYETNVPGLFAAGDVIGGKLQIAKAVYDGMMVAESMHQYLKNKSVK